MIEETKYYIPKLEDIYLGYSVELYLRNKWVEVIIENLFDFNDILDIYNEGKESTNIRTKQLDSSDIESLGWVLYKHYVDFKTFRKDKFTLVFRENDILIRLRYTETYSETLFKGKCKSINELKKIMEWTIN